MACFLFGGILEFEVEVPGESAVGVGVDVAVVFDGELVFKDSFGFIAGELHQRAAGKASGAGPDSGPTDQVQAVTPGGLLEFKCLLRRIDDREQTRGSQQALYGGQQIVIG